MTDATLAEMMEPTRQKPSYVDDCLRQIDDVKEQVLLYQSQLHQHIEGMKAEITSHLWVSAEFATPAADKLKQTQDEVQTLLIRIMKTREGFELLPVESELLDECQEEEEEDPSGVQALSQ